MKKILASSAALSVLCLVPSNSANAQAVFDSVYTQPQQMVDGYHVGARFDGARKHGPGMAVAPQKCQAEAACRWRFGDH